MAEANIIAPDVMRQNTASHQGPFCCEKNFINAHKKLRSFPMPLNESTLNDNDCKVRSICHKLVRLICILFSSPLSFSMSEDCKLLLCQVSEILLLAEKTYTVEERQITKLAVAVENSILVFEVETSMSQG